MPPLSNVTCASAVRSLAVLCVPILLLVAAATPVGASSRLNVQPHQKGISVRLAGKQQGTVVYFLNRHRVAVKRYAPYRAVITRGQFANRTKQLVVARDARTGEALATTTVDTSLAPAPTASGEGKGGGRNPTVSLTAGPAASTSSTSATFAWTANKADITTCTLDGVARGDCASPLTYTGLAPGSHTFVVTVGNKFGASSATAAWQITKPPAPTPPPTLALISAPPSTTVFTTATVSWAVSGATSVWCSLDDRPEAPCTSPATFADLSVGLHQLVVAANNIGGTATLTVSWTVEAPAPTPALPTITVTSQPTATTTSTSATVAFTTTGATSVGCKLDALAEAACTSPVTYSGLSSGAHRLVVSARNAAGVQAATVDWTVQSSTSSPPTAPASSPGVTPPAPPTSYSLPTGATYVRTSSELSSALGRGAPEIVLADGVYDNSTYFNNTASDVYAEHLGGATLTAGMLTGGNFGPGNIVIRGLVFDVNTNSKAFNGAVIWVWGQGGNNASVLDTVIRGNWAVNSGIFAYNPSGFVAQRLQLSSFTDSGLTVTNNAQVSYGGSTARASTVADIVVDGVRRPTPGSSNGTAEAGVWIGNPVTNGVRRLKIRNVWLSGLETVNNAWDTEFSDLDIDMTRAGSSTTGVGVYMEHKTIGCRFTRLNIKARAGFNAEWNYGIAGNGQRDITITNGTIVAAGTGNTVGIVLDEGTGNVTVSGIKFVGQSWGGIGVYKPEGTMTFTQNDYSGLLSSAVPVRYEHI
jgi:hypothetical protein